MAGGQIPMVPFYTGPPGSKDYQWMDIYNALGRKRTLFVGRFLDDESCNQLIASLVWLASQNDKDPITLYFNVPGALSKPSLAVFDVMRRMTCPLITINTGLTVGMGALLCAVGTPGKRFALPNARFLMSRTGLEDGFQGQALEIQLAVREVLKDNEQYISEMARLCGQPTVKLANDLKRDFYLTAPEAAAYGVIDEVMRPAQPVKLMRYRGDDDDIIGYGHFAEVRRVKTSPQDVIVPYTSNNEDEFDEYAAKQLKQKNARPNPRDSKDPRVRFAGSRLKPPGIGKPPPPGGGGAGGGGGGKRPSDENPFKNTGW